MRCHFGTSKRGGVRYLPYAFAENGVAMLSSILNGVGPGERIKSGNGVWSCYLIDLLNPCEWGHGDYSLWVENLPKPPLKSGQLQELEP